MKIAVIIARILMGLVFVVLGMNGFLAFMGSPASMGGNGPAMDFLNSMWVTHYTWMVSGVQVIAGLLLLANRYVFLALVLLGAVLVSVLTFHITMMPSGLPLPLVVTVLWFIVAWSLRDRFALLFAQR